MPASELVRAFIIIPLLDNESLRNYAVGYLAVYKADEGVIVAPTETDDTAEEE